MNVGTSPVRLALLFLLLFANRETRGDSSNRLD
jgi:hypothetical protein